MGFLKTLQKSLKSAGIFSHQLVEAVYLGLKSWIIVVWQDSQYGYISTAIV